MKELEPSEKAARPHQGKNVKRFRDMWSMKQETLATALGGDWTQKKISQLESMEVIELALLEPLAKALHVTPEAIQHFDEEKTFAIISNTFNNQSSLLAETINYPNSNEEHLLEIKKIHEELLKAKDALLQEKDARIALLEKLMAKVG